MSYIFKDVLYHANLDTISLKTNFLAKMSYMRQFQADLLEKGKKFHNSQIESWGSLNHLSCQKMYQKPLSKVPNHQLTTELPLQMQLTCCFFPQ